MVDYLCSVAAWSSIGFVLGFTVGYLHASGKRNL